MNTVIYEALIVPVCKAPDGSTPTKIVATEENNGYAVFRTSHAGEELLKWFGRLEKNKAIEYAVDRGTKERTS